MDSLYQQERGYFLRSASWELRNVVEALSILPWLNGPRENARLDACKDILRERRERGRSD
jgi:hypothetical protein